MELAKSENEFALPDFWTSARLAAIAFAVFSYSDLTVSYCCLPRAICLATISSFIFFWRSSSFCLPSSLLASSASLFFFYSMASCRVFSTAVFCILASFSSVAGALTVLVASFMSWSASLVAGLEASLFSSCLTSFPALSSTVEELLASLPSA